MCGHTRAGWTGIGGMRLGNCAIMHCHVGCVLLCCCTATEEMNIPSDNMFPEPKYSNTECHCNLSKSTSFYY